MSMAIPPNDHALVTDETCLGCCRCPTCHGHAHWSKFHGMHACMDCRHQFREHTSTEGEQSDVLKAAGKTLADLSAIYEKRNRCRCVGVVSFQCPIHGKIT